MLRVLLLVVVLLRAAHAATWNQESCGRRQIHHVDTIFHGEQTQPGDWPWLVALYRISGPGSFLFTCGGSLVSNKAVVTAAHCVTANNRKIDAEDLFVVIGQFKLDEWTKREMVESFDIAPNYLPSGRNHSDLAVLVLKDEVAFNNNVQPVCLWNEEMQKWHSGERGVVVGWGLTESGRVSNTPLSVWMNMVNKEQCHGLSPYLVQIAVENTFCAFNDTNSGPCKGDSGGGFYVNVGGQWMLRGIASRNLNKKDENTGGVVCDLSLPSVFTDVAKFLPWVSTQASIEQKWVPSTNAELEKEIAELKQEKENCRHSKLQLELKYIALLQDTWTLNLTKLGEKYYYFSLNNESMSWHDALKFCRSRGMELASVKNSVENKLISDHKRKIGGKWHWIGATDAATEGRWTWSSTGTALTYVAWDSAHSLGNSDNEDCMYMYYNADINKTWDDFDCNGKTNFICEVV